MSGSRTAGSNTSTQLGGLLGNKYAPLPAKPGPATSQSTQSNRKPTQEPPKQSQEPPKPMGGKMNLMKALEASRQVAPEPEPPAPAKGGKGAVSATNNRQTSASTAATNSKPQSGVTHNRNGGKAFPPADESGEEFNMDDYKEDEGEEEQEDDGDSVFDKRLGGAPEVDGDYDDEDGHQNSSPSDEESEEDKESGYGQKGVVMDEADPNLDEEEDQSEDVEYPATREAVPPTKVQASSIAAAANRPTSAAQKPNNTTQQAKKEISKPSNASKPKEKPQNRKPTNIHKTGPESEYHNSSPLLWLNLVFLYSN